MSFWDIFLKLCSKNRTTPSAVCGTIGLSNAAASKWKKGAVPNSVTLQKISDHFGVSVSYLLGETDEKKNCSNNSVLFFDIFTYLCKEKGISPTRASIEIGFSRGSVSYWRKKYSGGIDAKPDTYTAQKIADYFGVSVDYLLGRSQKDAEDTENTEQEGEIIQRIRSLAKEKGIKLSYICQQLGLTGRTYFNDLENKGGTIPSHRLKKIADILGTTTSYLLGETDDAAPSASDEIAKVALFGGADNVTEEMWEEVKRYAEYIMSKRNSNP